MNATKSRQSKQPQVFTITFRIEDDMYFVYPLKGIHPEVAVKAYRIAKQTGDMEIYDVRLTTEGHLECDCLGFQRWGSKGTRCKHIRCLQAAGMMPEVQAPAVPA